ncbi:hypothetical protein BDY19DRAFT_395369 [Irpex rosettiformis]|uniref:Uncharacterized protein n=1 Tax=Irpex rosettiformis TaxID=378272 RepID=A0ACB8TV20_9APHY|nr:hypothetical protein BDY19DRAFT_395369 [Irpex rosettiformis]
MSSSMSPESGRTNNKPSEQLHTTRQRSSTRSAPQPPPLELQVPLSQQSRSTSSTRETRSRSKLSPAGSSTRSGGSHYSPSSIQTSSQYGSQTTLSPLSLSPDSISPFGDISASLPTSLSVLSSDPELELVSPASFGSYRPPPSPRTLSPAQHAQSSSSPRLAGHLSHSNLRIHTTNTTRSAPISRKPSTNSLDRDAGFHLDMKRLLSKPAQPSHSGSSVVSIPSDPELSGGTSHSPRHPRSFSQQVQSSRPHTDTSPMRRATDSPKTLTAVSNSAYPYQGHNIKSSTSKASSGQPAAKEAGTNQPQRNVLRRKSSAKSNPATPTAATFKAPAQETPTRSSSSKTQRFGTPRRAASATAEPISVVGLRRNQEPPSHLTPAGAVVHAYKQQEQRREQLAEMAESNDELRHQTAKASASNSAQRQSQNDGGGDDEEEEGGIYYTVFGGSVGRVVAVGSAADSSWDVSYDDFRSRRSHTRDGAASSSSSTPGSIPSRLGRKISGRFKKTSVGVIKHGRDQSPHGSTHRPLNEQFDGRPSMSERRTITSAGAATSGRAASTSVDGFVDIRAALAIPSVRNGTAEKQDGERKSKEGKTLRSVKSVIGKDKDTDKDSSSGSKFQKLIKRFSSAGGLRDRYTREAAPPVPALPKDYQLPAPSRLTFDIKPSERQSPAETRVLRFMQSRSSLSGVRPSIAPQQQASRKEPLTGARPSTTTRSSSPISSDMASVHFFSKSHSARSSVSSYGAELPPLPSALEQHILSPSELSKLHRESEGDSSRQLPRRAQSSGPDDYPVLDSGMRSLPPPRRHDPYRSSSSPASSLPASPTVPASNVEEPALRPSTLSRLSLPTSEFGIREDVPPPPRPPRSSRRKPPTELTSPTSITPISPPMPPTPRTPRSPNVPKINVSVARASMGGPGSSPYSPSPEGSHSSPASSTKTRSPMRFREMEPTTVRLPLSEAEKRAKWDDLLMRSDQAGGTLHIGESGLMSDNVRFSTYSEYSVNSEL